MLHGQRPGQLAVARATSGEGEDQSSGTGMVAGTMRAAAQGEKGNDAYDPELEAAEEEEEAAEEGEVKSCLRSSLLPELLL